MENENDSLTKEESQIISLEDEIKNFNDAISNISDDDTVNIILHNIPDPDAISCGWAMKQLLTIKNIKSEIYHSGEISHMQNVTMNNLLHIPLKMVEGVVEGGKNICVDCTPKNSCVNDAFLIVDHHENTPEADYVINNPNIGSCATIMWNIFKSEVSDMSEYKPLATALMIGIRTDTKDMSSENIHELDFKAWQELYYYSDIEKVQKIMNYDKPRYYYDKMIIMNKEGNFIEKDGMFVGGVEFCTSKQRDVIAMLGDDYLRREGTTSVMIFCLTDKRYIDISMRTRLSSLNVGVYLKKLFGENNAGGTSYQGGARIEVGDFFNTMREDESLNFWGLICNRVFNKVTDG